MPRSPATELIPSTAEQQANLRHLQQDARRVFLADYRRYGRIGHAADKAGINRDTAEYWCAHDPEFRAIAASCKADLADELAGHGLDELRFALSQPGMVTLHPVHYMHEMQFLEPGRRPAAPMVSIDNRSLTLNLPPAQAAAIAGALFGSVPTDVEVGLPALTAPAEPQQPS